MIENILKKKAAVFNYGTITAVNPILQQVRVRLRTELLVWVQTGLVLNTGDTVIVAQNDKDSSWFIVQYSQKAIPSQGTLLLV